jgi:hypothetical protein
MHVEEIGKPEGKSLFERPKHRRWESNIKTGIREIGCGGMD